jgi:hypothetical protein
MNLVEKERLVSSMLAEMCDLIGKTIALIPPEHVELRVSACAFALDQINKVIKGTLIADGTEH